MSIEALKQALEALEIGWSPKYVNGVDAREKGMKAITSIRQATADFEKQEPVGVMCINCGSSWSDEILAEIKKKNSDLISCCPERKMVNVYTHPQPKQEQGEPVENRFVRELREYGKTNQGAYLFPSWDIHRALKYLDGYTHPQPKREWVGLTDADLNEIASVTFGREGALALYVEAIEAKLKEKNA